MWSTKSRAPAVSMSWRLPIPQVTPTKRTPAARAVSTRAVNAAGSFTAWSSRWAEPPLERAQEWLGVGFAHRHRVAADQDRERTERQPVDDPARRRGGLVGDHRGLDSRLAQRREGLEDAGVGQRAIEKVIGVDRHEALDERVGRRRIVARCRGGAQAA